MITSFSVHNLFNYDKSQSSSGAVYSFLEEYFSVILKVKNHESKWELEFENLSRKIYIFVDVKDCNCLTGCLKNKANFEIQWNILPLLILHFILWRTNIFHLKTHTNMIGKLRMLLALPSIILDGFYVTYYYNGCDML